MVGGVHVVDPEDPVLESEIYTPGMNWDTGHILGLPNCSVLSKRGQNWQAELSFPRRCCYPTVKCGSPSGNTNADSGDPDSDVNVGGVFAEAGIKKIELYEPDYIATPNQITKIRELTQNTDLWRAVCRRD